MILKLKSVIVKQRIKAKIARRLFLFLLTHVSLSSF